MAGPCTGLTILDFSLGMPGSLCTLVMADYGAEVIKVQRAPGIPKEKSRTVRPVHGPATIHLPFQGYALPLHEASVLSLRDTTDFPASVPNILGSGCPSVAGS